MSDTNAYRWEDVNGGIHFGAPMQGDPPEKNIKNPIVKKIQMGGNNTQGNIYYQAEKTEEDKAREAQIVKNKKDAYDSQQAISKSIREAKEAKAAAKKIADEAERLERMRVKNLAGVTLTTDCHVALPGGVGADKKIDHSVTIGMKDTESKDVVTYEKDIGLKEFLPDKIKQVLPFDCRAGAAIRVNPGGIALKVNASDVTVKKIDDTVEIAHEAKDTVEEGIQKVKDAAKKAAEEAAKDILK